MKLTTIAAFLTSIANPAYAATTLIDFSDQPAGTPFVTPLASPLVYPSVTFTSANGLRLFTFASLGLDRGLCPHATNACRSAVTLTFSSAVDTLSFDVFQVDEANKFLSVSALTTSGAVNRSVALTRGFAANTVMLSGIAGITQVTLDGTSDEEGVLYDNFRFDTGSTVSAVPEPASWAMMLGGFAVVGMLKRSARKSVQSTVAGS